MPKESDQLSKQIKHELRNLEDLLNPRQTHCTSVEYSQHVDRTTQQIRNIRNNLFGEPSVNYSFGLVNKWFCIKKEELRQQLLKENETC